MKRMNAFTQLPPDQLLRYWRPPHTAQYLWRLLPEPHDIEQHLEEARVRHVTPLCEGSVERECDINKGRNCKHSRTRLICYTHDFIAAALHRALNRPPGLTCANTVSRLSLPHSNLPSSIDSAKDMSEGAVSTPRSSKNPTRWG